MGISMPNCTISRGPSGRVAGTWLVPCLPFICAFLAYDFKARFNQTRTTSGPSFSPQIAVFAGSFGVSKGLLHT